MGKNLSTAQWRWLFYGGWFLLLALQASFTSLFEDEAYYWMYSRDLAWGYFDHPPMVALIIKIGYTLFGGTFGVRIIPILMAVGSIAIWENIIKPSNLKLFYGLVASVGVLHFVGFLGVPVSPLLFFATLFFWVYQKFLAKPDWKFSAVLAVLIACMMLSKYHGIVIIGLTVLANLKLFRSKYFWGIVALATILLVPHILWQIQSDFPSFNYHLNERHNRPWEWNFTGYYLLYQPFILGPLTGIFLLIAAWRFKSENLFERTMLFVYWGGYLFFLLLSFRSWIEGHWTLFTVIPGIYIGYKQLEQMPKLRKVFMVSVPISLVLIAAARMLLLVNLLPQTPFLAGFHGKEVWSASIKEVAGDRPVAFINSFQKASLYTFYSGSEGFSINSWGGRKNQFNLWDYYERYRGQAVVIIPDHPTDTMAIFPSSDPPLRYYVAEDFQAFPYVRITATDVPLQVHPGDTISFNIEITTTAEVDFDSLKNPAMLVSHFSKETWSGSRQELFTLTNAMLGTTRTVKLYVPKTKGNIDILFTIVSGNMPEMSNSYRYPVEVLE